MLSRTQTRFLVVAGVCILVLSVVWVWLGPWYNWLLLHALSPFLPANAMVAQDGHLMAIDVHRLGWTPQSVVINGMGAAYGVIVAASLLVASPGLRVLPRVGLIAVAILVGSIVQLVGMYMLVQRMDGVLHGIGDTQDVVRVGTLFAYLRLFIPSVVWLGALATLWKPSRIQRVVPAPKMPRA